MAIGQTLNIYSKQNQSAFMVGSIFFLLYGILKLMDMNNYIKEFNVEDPSQTDRTTFVYAYMAGYFMFVLQLLIALVTIFIIILVIRIAVATIFGIFANGGGEGGEGQAGGAAYIQAGAAINVSNTVMNAVKTNMKWILGFIACPIFFIMFLIVIPIFLLCFLLIYVGFYKPSIVQGQANQSSRIMLTHHNFIMFVISSLFIISFIFSVYYWFKMAYLSGNIAGNTRRGEGNNGNSSNAGEA